MSTIELGEMQQGQDSLSQPGFDRRLARRIALVLVVALCLAGLAASAVPRQRAVQSLWTMSIETAQGTTLSRDGVFVHRTADGLTTVTAHELATGAVRWQRRFGGTVGYLQAAESSGLLLVPAQGHLVKLPSANDGSAFHAEFHQQTIAISAATGAEVWRTAGEPHSVDGGTALLTEYTPEADLARMRLVRLSDHGTIWSRDTARVGNWTVLPSGERPSKIVTATDDGEIKVYAYGSGALVSTARIPWVESRPEEGYFNDLGGTGDVLVVNRSRAEVFEMSVYRTDTMAELWRASDTNGYAFPCGSALCLNDGSGLVAYDTTTGARRWRIDGAADAWQVSADRLVVGEGSESGRHVLVDAVTGRTLGASVEGTLAWNGPQDESVVVLRPTESPPNRTAVVRWDLATGRQWLLGAIDPMGNPPCSALPGHLACFRGDQYEVLAVM
ncbi:PQQ-binding-like beta-propeller repeat protein [Actinoplanes solisilvae]|uniref:outer membrane protein assembly factor BamB family protein n=1 Tax=Actinoplanes solisilvae TaxID=2486853 RepID=UPI000FDBB773|nr:PQQ-binding-like beta-propeller repeat protein [Actinoplanes solisilvae]